MSATPPLSDAVLHTPAEVNAFESTVERLAAAIRLGVFTTGEQLPPERELAHKLGVSRVNLREAIAALRQAGMVTTSRGRNGGTVVRYAGERPKRPRSGEFHESGARLRDALDFRRVVEPGAAALAASRELSEEQRDWLRTSAAEVREARDAAAHRIADARLHLAIVSVSGSTMLVEAVTRAQAGLGELLRAIPVLSRNIEHSHVQHDIIVAAVLAGDAELARSTMELHCDATSALLRGLLG